MLLEFVRRALAYLTERRALPLTALVRWKFILAKVLAQKISQLPPTGKRRIAISKRYLAQKPPSKPASNSNLTSPRTGYAPHWTYEGHPYQFQKHYYAAVGEFKNKGEEYECAKALDMTGKVKHWVRNLERRGFLLPLAKRNFYPDFVAELTDGRIPCRGAQGQGLRDERRQQRKMQRRRTLGRTRAAARRCF